MIIDPRTCHFNAMTIVCTGADSPSCLTPAQAQIANVVWRGSVDENGTLLSPGDQPYGSELAWAGSIALDKGVVFSQDTSSEFAFSYDFPNYMAKFSPTGITNKNIQFTSSQFAFLDTMSHLNDPTNPDLSAFAGHGGKLLMWEGWADQGTSPYGTLNYHDAVRKQMGASVASSFVTLYLIPGVYHCAGGPFAATMDFLTPLMNWVEDNASPGRQVVAYHATASSTSPVTRTRPVYPYPLNAVYTGQGDVNSASNYVSGPATPGVSDVLDWAGLMHYTPTWQWWCSWKSTDFNAVMGCGTLKPATP